MHPYEEYLRQSGRTTNMLKSIDQNKKIIYIVVDSNNQKAVMIGLLLRNHPKPGPWIENVQFISAKQFIGYSRGTSPTNVAFYFDHRVLDNVTDQEFWIMYKEWNKIKNGYSFKN